MELFDTTMSSLEKGILRSNKTQEVIAQNIANANTPGYVPQRFDEVLNKAVEKSDKKNVVLEEELADMSKNSTKYSAYVKLMTAKLAMLRTIVSQGRK